MSTPIYDSLAAETPLSELKLEQIDLTILPGKHLYHLVSIGTFEQPDKHTACCSLPESDPIHNLPCPEDDVDNDSY